jgi:ribonucleoside-triphosphate reductase
MDQFGGQSIPCFDYYMSDGVRKTFHKEFKRAVNEGLRFKSYDRDKFLEVLESCQYPSYLNPEALDNITKLCYNAVRKTITQDEYQELLTKYEEAVNCYNIKDIYVETLEHYQKLLNSNGPWEDAYDELIELYDQSASDCLKSQKDEIKDFLTQCYEIACERTEEETMQAMESVIHNFSTMSSRAGAQVPFSSLNFGTDTSPEGRLVIKQLLLSAERGLGDGRTPIFPITVFKMKKGVNYNPEDINYDLFKLAMKVSARRLFPNFVNLDAPYNAQYYQEGRPETEVASMGCRTRVLSNVNGDSVVTGRGNFAFTTLNLPKIAIESKKNMKKFYEILDKYMEFAKNQLLWRYNLIGKRHAYNYPFLMGQHVWMGSEDLKPNDTIDKVLKHASISIGFCGLAEALKYLTGYHHGESEESQKLGLEIVSHMRKNTDAYIDETHLNWSLFATPEQLRAAA